MREQERREARRLSIGLRFEDDRRDEHEDAARDTNSGRCVNRPRGQLRARTRRRRCELSSKRHAGPESQRQRDERVRDELAQLVAKKPWIPERFG